MAVDSLVSRTERARSFVNPVGVASRAIRNEYNTEVFILKRRIDFTVSY